MSRNVGVSVVRGLTDGGKDKSLTTRLGRSTTTQFWWSHCGKPFFANPDGLFVEILIWNVKWRLIVASYDKHAMLTDISST